MRGGEGGAVRLEGATRGCSLGAVAAWLVVSVCEASRRGSIARSFEGKGYPSPPLKIDLPILW